MTWLIVMISKTLENSKLCVIEGAEWLICLYNSFLSSIFIDLKYCFTMHNTIILYYFFLYADVNCIYNLVLRINRCVSLMFSCYMYMYYITLILCDRQ